VGFARDAHLAQPPRLEQLDPVVELLFEVGHRPRLAVRSQIFCDHRIAVEAHQIGQLIAPPATQHQPFGLEQIERGAHATRSSRGRLNTIVSRPAPCALTLISKRSAKASITSSTSVSGAEAPAVMPSVAMPSNCDQSIRSARSTSTARSQPARLA